MDNNTPTQPTENKSSIGSVMGTIIIIAVIILGALYFWGKRLEESRATAQMRSDARIHEANVVQTLPPIQIHIQATTTTKK